MAADELIMSHAAMDDVVKKLNQGRVNRIRRLREQAVEYRMDRDKVVVTATGQVVGRISLLMAWTPPSVSAKCSKHWQCSVTADLSQVHEICQWLANGSLYSTAVEHWHHKPTRSGRTDFWHPSKAVQEAVG